MKDKLKMILKEHVDYCRRQMSWSGEHDVAIEKILELVNKPNDLSIHMKNKKDKK